MIDGLRSEDFKVADIDVSDDASFGDLASGTGLDIYGATANITTISGTALVGTTVNVGGKLASAIGTGSPTTTWGKVALGAKSATGTGSNLWLVFPTAFGATPIVVVNQQETAETIFAPAGSISAGSFYVETTSASQDFSWIALG